MPTTSGHTNTTAKTWKKMATKDYRDAYVSAHISNTVAAQIVTLREREGWTQKQLAQRSGMNQSRISALEDPNYENYEIATLKRVASAFDVGLTVRFCAYSEVVSWAMNLSSENLTVPTFATDRAPILTPYSAAAEAKLPAELTNCLQSTALDFTALMQPFVVIPNINPNPASAHD
jgi:transcriptional regulator with XRE-family HTH domain